MRFGDRLRNLRISRNLTQQQVADDLHISQSAVGAYETSVREPSFQQIQRLADYFNVPASSLFPTDDNRDEDRAAILSDTILKSKKLMELFDLCSFFTDNDLNALIAVASSLQAKYKS